MKIKISFTNEDMYVGSNKILLYLEKDQLFISNTINPKFLPLLKEMIPEYNEIVYFEQKKPVCPNCKIEMDFNGSRDVKPNMLEGVRKKQYICSKCGKTKVTNLNNYIPKNSNYSHDIGEKGLNYDYIGYLSYESKSELIELENDINIRTRTIL